MMSRHLAGALRQEGLTVREVTYEIDHFHRRPARMLLKLARFAGYVGSNPRRSISAWARIAATRQATLSDLARSAFNWTYVASIAASRRIPGSVTLLDQGIAQAAWSVGFAAQADSWLDLTWDPGAEAMVGPDMVVHVQAPLHLIRERLSRRDPHVSRLEQALGANDQPLRRAQAHSEAILRRLRSRGILVVDVASHTPEQLVFGAERIAAQIRFIQADPSGSAQRFGSESPPLERGGDRREERLGCPAAGANVCELPLRAGGPNGDETDVSAAGRCVVGRH
jgi:hypothetical protein